MKDVWSPTTLKVTPAPRTIESDRSWLQKSLPWLVALATGLLTIAAFAPAVRFDFVNWDDNSYLFGNDGLVAGGLSATGIRRAFTEPVFHSWMPLTVLSYQLDATLFGMEMWGFHLTSVVLHAVTAGLLCVALCRMTGRVGASTAVAALFSLHPLRVESVAWIAERKDVLSVLFLVLAMLAYEWYCRRPGMGRYALVFVALLASLLSKATAVTLPGLLLLLDVWPLGRLSVPGIGVPVRGDGTASPYPGRSWQMVLAEKLPLAALSIVFAFFQIVSSQRVLVAGESLPLVSRRLPNALYAFTWYLVKTIWPTDLHPAHTHFGVVHPVWLVALCGVGVLATVAIAVLAARRSPAVTVGLAWFAAALVPVIGLVPVGIQSHSDRFAYIPHIGLFAAIVWGGAALSRRLAISPVWTSIGAGLVLAALVVQTERQLGHWQDSDALWTHTLEIEPRNQFALSQYGAHKHRTGQDADAERLFLDAVDCGGDFTWLLAYLAEIYFDAGEFRRAKHYRDAAVRRRSTDPEVREIIEALADVDALAAQERPVVQPIGPAARQEIAAGLAAARAGRMDDALASFGRAIDLEPACAAAHNNAGLVHSQQHDSDKAIAAFRRAITLDDTNADYHVNLAAELLSSGAVDEADAACMSALRLAPWDRQAAALRGEIRAQLRRD
jgi:tetratricopeptide (TPR) repeat protein